MKDRWSYYRGDADTFFAEDGSYGAATDMVLVDTTNWDADDWDLIDHARDCERAELAKEIADSKWNASIHPKR